MLCVFPVLYPNGAGAGAFGEHHPQKVKLSSSEFIKSCLYNKDSRFRKDVSYVFYLLHQKSLRKIATGVYNVLNHSKGVAMSVKQLLARSF